LHKSSFSKPINILMENFLTMGHRVRGGLGSLGLFQGEYAKAAKCANLAAFNRLAAFDP
jgi:hypothetical protein